jgi:hypothetical protein
MSKQILVGIDDTDFGESIGTGALARELQLHLAGRLGLASNGITRHQFLVHPDIPYTSHNSSACIALTGEASVSDVVRVATGFLSFLFHPGADPGLCVARPHQLGERCAAFGRRAQSEVVSKGEALRLAREHHVELSELGGEGIGVIGAFGGCALRASGRDGRYISLPGIRAFAGLVSVARLQEASPIQRVVDETGQSLTHDQMVETRGGVRPVLLDGMIVLPVESCGDGRWRVPKRNKQEEK